MSPEQTNASYAEQKIIQNKWDGLVHAYSVEFDATEKWGLEVIKTLFLLNGAGITGVFALVARTGTERSALPFNLFALGILAAVVSMTLGRYSHAQAASGWMTLISTFSQNQKLEVLEIHNRPLIEMLQRLSVVFAFGSGILCVYAGIKLYFYF